MGTSKRLAPHYDMQAQHQAILTAAKRGPLQSLSDRELGLRETPVTVYPRAAQRRVRAWVRFGLEPICVEARVVRSTHLAAGIEFRVGGQTFRCWVWGNAVSVEDGQE